MKQKKSNIKPLDYIQESPFGENGFSLPQGQYWYTKTLVDASKDLEEFDFDLLSIDLSCFPWKFSAWNFYDFLYHVHRADISNSKYPIILTPTGYICDGWHRVTKAILEGKRTIKAVRLRVMPEPDEYTNNNEN